jgi:hypothetical protein
MASFPHQLDHLILGTPDLQAGIAMVEDHLHVRMLPGGSHPAWGTRNAILPLGPRIYLEVIGPDPESRRHEPPTLFGLGTLTTPRLLTWAAMGRHLDRLAQQARAHGVELGTPSPGSRLRPDGTVLTWTLTDPFDDRQGGVLPFFIDWPSSDHPAALRPADVELVDLSASHPDVITVRAQLRVLEIDLRLSPAARPALHAVLRARDRTVMLI